MSLENRAKAVAKNIEGQAQEFKGEITGNDRDLAQGRAKQVESELRHQAENVREQTDTDDSGAENRLKATAKNIEGKLQEFVGEVTGDPQTKAEGRAKQAESKFRHGVEDIKDNFR